MGEVEAQPFRIHQGTLLLHMVTQHLAQGRVQQMGSGMIEHGGAPPRRVHLTVQGVAHAQLALLQETDMDEHAALLLGIARGKARIGGAEHALVAHLAARLGIEGRMVEDHHALVTGVQSIYRPAVFEQGRHRTVVLESP